MKVEPNRNVDGLVEQLVNDLKKKGQYAQYEQMNERQRRHELLLVLHDKVYSRRQKVN